MTANGSNPLIHILIGEVLINQLSIMFTSAIDFPIDQLLSTRQLLPILSSGMYYS